MELLPPPNTQTKEKMRKYRMQKVGRRISLFRTAGNFRNSHWSPRPESRCQNIFHKHHHHKRTPSPTKSAARKHSPSPSAQLQWTKKTESENWSDSTESAPETAEYHQQSAAQDKVESTILSPESPPDYERGLSNTDYIPKSPIYRPAGYSDEDSDKDSMLDFNLDEENWDEDPSDRGQKTPSQTEEDTPQEGPSSEQTRHTPSPQTCQPDEQVDNIYQDSKEDILRKMSEIADAVQPVNSVAEEDCWKKRRMFNAYKRLNMAYKLNQWDQTDGVTNLAEDTKTAASPSQHKEDPQADAGDNQPKTDKAAQLTTEIKDKSTQKYLCEPMTLPVEPMTCPPEIVNPIPSTPSQMSPGMPNDVPANFSAKLKKVARMRTGPLCPKAKLVKMMATGPRVILQRLPIEEIKVYSATI